ncbi:SH3 domain-containing protein [Sporobacter termitidis DSM 10068]|uniref:SH3 domain-containing protein n=1 Tax=Sporobacter termitidis DSM 10068 TaxID=1123282 RepID=A0A1M5TNA9_9FIRM|nr:SH3 domain-containing protein [Sporobacter termitidis]SHH52178.1 SH3 domain-containing protein [Sporobacter termitidis DSM 10068]
MVHVKKLRKAAAFLLIAVTLVLAGFMPKAAAAGVTSAAGLVSTSSGALNVRSSAGTSGAILTKLYAGTYVTLITKTGSWWYVEYAPSAYGYVSADYIKYVYGTYAVQVAASSGNLNVRSGAGTSYGVIGTIPSGRTVLVLSESGGWDRVLYNGTATGYVSTSYLKSLMAWPAPASHKINQYFSSAHNGVDIGSSVHGVAGDSVTAAMAGKVVYAGTLDGYGYVVYINSYYNGQPIQTRYAHLMSAPLVSAGAYVGVGQRIGYMGNTGESTGAHLHFEVRLRNSSADCIANADSTPVNPLNYVK